MEIPIDLRLNVDLCINDYKKNHKPSYVIVNENTHMELKSEGVIIPDANEQEREYLLHENGSERIEIHFLESVSGKERPILEELVAHKKLPIILCTEGVLTDFKHLKSYDLAIPHEKLEKMLELDSSESQ
ncbi:hypothetical protein A3K73_02225 [Candidatus Pacearchaeota archaeon RBG_13_36_9]|nr:MAG: hypothetical protein A3K73_02225 [Candidatus Pacearchaeota archaeon RBG_13_36_9]